MGARGVRSTLIPLADGPRGFSPPAPPPPPPPGGGGPPPGPWPIVIIPIIGIIGIILGRPVLVSPPEAVPVEETQAPAATTPPDTASPDTAQSPDPVPAPHVIVLPARPELVGPTTLAQAAQQAPAHVPPPRVLPYTGANIWIPFAVGLGLIAFGWPVRRRTRRQNIYDLATRCIIAGIVVCLSPGVWIGFTGWRTGQAQARALSVWAQASGGLQRAQRAVGARAASDDMVLWIPSLNLTRFVPDGATPDKLNRYGLGRISWTERPSEDGVVGIAGHRTTYGAPFHRLDLLEVGDVVQVDFRGRRYIYRVTGREVVRPDQVDVLQRAPGRRAIALVTCEPVYSAARRLVVFATLQSEAPLVSLR